LLGGRKACLLEMRSSVASGFSATVPRPQMAVLYREARSATAAFATARDLPAFPRPIP
jgi:hypothetical protein